VWKSRLTISKALANIDLTANCTKDGAPQDGIRNFFEFYFEREISNRWMKNADGT
jgi:hypothetical protein